MLPRIMDKYGSPGNLNLSREQYISLISRLNTLCGEGYMIDDAVRPYRDVTVRQTTTQLEITLEDFDLENPWNRKEKSDTIDLK